MHVPLSYGRWLRSIFGRPYSLAPAIEGQPFPLGKGGRAQFSIMTAELERSLANEAIPRLDLDSKYRPYRGGLGSVDVDRQDRTAVQRLHSVGVHNPGVDLIRLPSIERHAFAGRSRSFPCQNLIPIKSASWRMWFL